MLHYQGCHLKFHLGNDEIKKKSKQTPPTFFPFYQQDTKIASLERNIRDLEDEIQMLKANGVLNTEDREEEIKQIEVYKSHSKFMKTKVGPRVSASRGLDSRRKLQLTCLLLQRPT